MATMCGQVARSKWAGLARLFVAKRLAEDGVDRLDGVEQRIRCDVLIDAHGDGAGLMAAYAPMMRGGTLLRIITVSQR